MVAGGGAIDQADREVSSSSSPSFQSISSTWQSFGPASVKKKAAKGKKIKTSPKKSSAAVAALAMTIWVMWRGGLGWNVVVWRWS